MTCDLKHNVANKTTNKEMYIMSVGLLFIVGFHFSGYFCNVGSFHISIFLANAF